MNTWMIVERLENWCADRDTGFTTIGFPDRYRNRLEQLQEGDELIIYVASRVSAFADLREITGRATRKRNGSLMVGKYDNIYPIIIETKPIIVLERDAWLPIQNLLDRLTFTRELRDWRNTVRSALRKLEAEDARLLKAAMQEAARQKLDRSA